MTNKTPEEAQEIMGAFTKLEVKDRKNIHDCLESCGVDYVSIIVDGGRNSGMPQFNDLEIDSLPVPMIGLWEMEEYGYTWNEMLPLTQGRASDFLAMTCLYTCSMRTALKQPCMTKSSSQGMGESSA